jgi:DNA-directed RNA polymerase specialized sigma24 family protein
MAKFGPRNSSHDVPDDRILLLLRNVELGDDSAIADLWTRYYESVRHLIGSWRGRRAQQGDDAEQLALDVLFDVTQQIQRGVCHSMASEGQFIALLYVTARHRFLSQRKTDTRGKRFRGQGAGLTGPIDNVVSRDAGPAEEALELEEELISLLSLPDDNKLSDILAAIFEGLPKPQIAVELSISRRTLDRLVLNFKKRWLNHINGKRLPIRDALLSAPHFGDAGGFPGAPSAPRPAVPPPRENPSRNHKKSLNCAIA